MSTGILGTATRSAGLHAVSEVLLALAVLGEVVLAAALIRRLLTDRAGFLTDAGTPASLTGVAATAVIGGATASLGWIGVAWALLGAATLLWLVLLPVVLRHWQVPTVGASFLVCVATQGLAALAAVQGRVTGNRPVAAAGSAVFLLGLVLYAIVLTRFDWRQLAVGAGDHWVVAGALAISSLAGAELLRTSDHLHLLGSIRRPLRMLDLVLWAVALAGYVMLLGCEMRWPRRRYDIRRWATVFPMCMTAAATFAVAQVEGLPSLAPIAQVLLWPALAAWVLTSAGATRRQLRRRRVHP